MQTSFVTVVNTVTDHVSESTLSKYFAIGLIHDSGHVVFQIVMQISHVLCWGQTLEKGQIAENRLVEILK